MFLASDPTRTLWPALLLSLAAIGAPSSSVAQTLEVDSRQDRYLGPGRTIAVLAFPLEAALNASAGAPQLSVEVRIDLGAGWAIGVRPIGVWYLPGARRDVHGGGVGAAIALQWYFERPLAGGFVGLQAGDVEAFIGGERGRLFGATAIFGYAISWDNGAMLSVGLGLGYWHRAGVLDSGVQWPEILSLRLGAGWGIGEAPPHERPPIGVE